MATKFRNGSLSRASESSAGRSKPLPTDRAATRLADLPSIAARYCLPGPHTSAIVTFPIPGQRGDDIAVRWHSSRKKLRRLGSDEGTLRKLDDAVETLQPRGLDVLLTANADSAAYCWLASSSAPSSPSQSLMTVNTLPSLVPAMAEVVGMGIVVGAVVDRIGADLFVIDHVDLERAEPVEGEEAHFEPERSRMWSMQQRRQRSERVWERNASSIAAAVSSLAQGTDATMVVLTGEEHMVGLVNDWLDAHTQLVVRRIEAGSRHEPQSPERLHIAAERANRLERDRTFNRGLERLWEELGQQDRAVSGITRTLEAVGQNQVGTLFIDTANWQNNSHADEIVHAALSSGASVVPTPRLVVDDGVAGLLRSPLHLNT